MKVGFLHSLIRKDEKLLINEFRSRKDTELILIDDRRVTFNLEDVGFSLDVVMERSINHSRALHALNLFENSGIKCVNASSVANICGDKILTSVALKKHKVPQPDVRVAFTQDSALQAMEELGFPVVLKPSVGSWGRLLSKINDKDTAVSILEHRKTLGNYHHSIFYIQKYVEKKGRDIRSIVIGDECISAIYRTSKHWITNAARGGVSFHCPVTTEIKETSLQAAKAVGGGILGIDLFETEKGLLVNEVNYTMEYNSSLKATCVNIPKLMVDYVMKAANGDIV